MTRTIKYILLALVILASGVAISPFDFSFEPPAEENSMRPLIIWLELICPGVFFTIYLLFLFRKMLDTKKTIKFFFILIIFYFLSIYSSFHTWGLLVPVVGGAGAFLVGKLFRLQTQMHFTVGYAVLCSTAGLLLFYAVSGRASLSAGIGFAIIIALWQVTIGIRCIKEAD